MTLPGLRPALAARGGSVRGMVGLALALAVLLAFAPPAGAQSVPGAVEGLRASGLGSDIALGWDPPASDGGSPITGYRVRYRAYSGGAAGEWSGWTTSGSGTGSGSFRARTVTFRGLDGSKTHDFEVQALNAQGAGPGAIVKVHPRPPAPEPSLAHASPDTSALTLSWSPVTGTGAPLTGYVWEYREEFENSIPGGHWQDHSVPPTTTEVTVRGLAPRTRYAFRVRAVTASRQGYNATIAGWTRTAATITAVTPATLTTGAIRANGDRATLRATLSRACWADPDRQVVCGAGSWNAGAAASHFSVTGLPGVAVEGVSNRSGRSIDLTVSYDGSDVDTDATLRFRIAPGAHDDDNTIVATIPVTATDDDALPTLSISDITVPEGSFEQTGFSRAFTIRVTPTPNQDIRFKSTTDSKPGDTADDSDYSRYPTAALVSLRTLPANHSTLTLTYLVYGDAIDEDDETFTWTLSDLSANARFAGGGETLSAKITIVDNDTRSGPPTGLSATAGTNAGEVDLEWTAPAEPGVLDGSPATVSGYQYRTATTSAGLTGSRWWHTNSPSPSFTVTGLAAGEHHFQVRAVTGVPGGAVSGSASATVQTTGASGPPSVPPRLKLISFGPSGFRVWWAASTLPSGGRGTIEYDFQWKPSTRASWPAAFRTSTERGPHIDSPGRVTGEVSSNPAFGEDYHFRVRACLQGSNPRSCSAWSTPLLIDTPRVLGLVLSTSPATLTEDNLDGATLTVRLSWAEWVASPSPNDVSVTGVPGLRAGAVARRSHPRQAVVTLDFDGTNFDTDATLGLTIAPAAHTGANTVSVQGAPRVTAVMEPPNRPATGAPSIGGIAQVGQTLSAGAGDVADPDGLDDTSWSWQWVRVETGGTEQDIGGATEATYRVADADLDRRLKVRARFTDAAGGSEMRTSAATAPVTAAATPVATLVLTPVRIDESGPNNAATLSATLDIALATTTTLAVSAAPPGVVTLSGTTLTIPAGETASTGGGISATAVDDNVASGADAAVTLTATAPAGVTAPAPVTLSVAEDDAAPATVALSVHPTTVSEDGSATPTTVTAQFPPGSATLPTATMVKVQIGTSVKESGNTATPGTDYESVGDITVTIPARKTRGTRTFTFTPIRDADDSEGIETVSVTGSAAGVAVEPAALTVADRGTRTLSVADASAPEGAPVAFTVRLSGRALDRDLELVARPSSESGDTATAGADYATAVQDLTLRARRSSATFSVATIRDSDDELDETFTVTLSPKPGTSLPAGVTIADARATGTIVNEEPAAHRLPLVVPADHALGLRSITRLVNHSDVAGTVRIEAYDDAGALHGPVTLSIGANEAVQFSSADLEEGNADKGLSGGVGDGEGDWRLELTSTLDLQVLGYVLTTDGFLATMHDVVPGTEDAHRVPFFNPGRNQGLASQLRLVNSGAEAVEVSIEGIDARGDAGESAVELSLPAGAARTLSAQALESGDAEGLTGDLGTGAGKWQLVVSADRPIVVMSLLASATGYLSNLSTAPEPTAEATDADPAAHRLPLVIPADHAMGLRSITRLVNRSAEAGEVRIEAYDDEGVLYGPVTLTLDANEAVQFSSADLEEGNTGKGLSGSVGVGEGDWRLELTSTLDLQVLGYVLTTDGFLATMHDVVPGSEAGHRVPFFNPGRNQSLTSRLRVVNPGAEAAEVSIEGIDARGEAGQSAVVLSVPAGAARTVSASELESGDAEGLTGALGTGSGKWQLVVRSDRPVVVMSLLASATGYLSNLSTVPAAAESDD